MMAPTRETRRFVQRVTVLAIMCLWIACLPTADAAADGGKKRRRSTAVVDDEGIQPMKRNMTVEVDPVQVARNQVIFEQLIYPTGINNFFDVYFQHHALMNDHNEAFLDSLKEYDSWIENMRDPWTFLSENLASFLDNEGLTFRDADSDIVDDSKLNLFQIKEEMLKKGLSAVLKRENDVKHVPSPLETMLQQRFNTTVTTHAYISAGGAKALKVGCKLFPFLVPHVS